MVSISLLFTFGVWLLQQQGTLPDLRWASLLIILSAALSLPRHNLWQDIGHRITVLILAACCGFFYAAWIAQHRLADELPAAWQGRDISLVGVVAEMPRQHEHGLSFAFDVDKVLSQDAQVPEHILLSTYNAQENPKLVLHAGERWQLNVRLKQPHGTSNPYNFDFEAWALERNLRAVGYVHAKGDNHRIDAQVNAAGYFIERLREAVRTHFQRVLGQAPYAGVLSALAIGDQGSIPAAQWQVFTRTGVNHLMSISGLHITMLAGLGFALTYWLWRRSVYLTLWLPARKAAALAGLLVALIYALLSGYGVPAQRTVYMLGTVAAAMWMSRNIAPSQLLAAALLVVVLLDPWAVIAPGFWLSFGAVALIFYITANRLGQRHWLIEYGRIQWAMSIGLIPPLLAMFQQISLVSPLANAFAIPLVSFVVVPLTLLGALLPFDWILAFAHACMGIVMLALEWLNNLPAAVWVQHAPPAWSIIAGMLGVIWILLPRGFPSRWLGIIFLLPMFLLQPDTPGKGSVRVTIFDVGQGLSVAAQTRNHALLYDSGPGFNSDANSGNRILVPALRGMGVAQLDKLILTHNDADHTGGALSVMQALPIGILSTSLPDDSPILLQATAQSRCHDGESWDWDGVHFEMLHPALASYTNDDVKNNDRGCVLRISTGQNSVLLAADIEKHSEAQLLKLHPDKLAASVLVVPHHGSKTSSTPAFVTAVHPRYAVFTVGYRNRFGHPKAEVVERYRANGSTLLRSDRDGAILLTMDTLSLKTESYRKSHRRYWQLNFPAEDSEPVFETAE
jgi:competence protein ComEC